jgi:hypothetical protein
MRLYRCVVGLRADFLSHEYLLRKLGKLDRVSRTSFLTDSNITFNLHELSGS